MRSNSARTAATGTRKSSHRNTVPRIYDDCARPVLERVFDKPLQRHDQAALVPDPHHHIGAGDLLDPAPFALDDQHVVEAYRLGSAICSPAIRLLNTGRAAIPAPGPHAGRGQQAGAELARARERHQHEPQPQQADDEVGAAREHPRLSSAPPRAQVVGGATGLRVATALLIELTQAIASQLRLMISSTLFDAR